MDLHSSLLAHSSVTASTFAMGREESKEQAKEAGREKEAVATAKKAAQRDKQWEQGAKDTSQENH